MTQQFLSKSELARTLNEPVSRLNRLERAGQLVPDQVRPRLKLYSAARLSKIAMALRTTPRV
jgi:ribosome-binding protein aMBF1 (putative translation factor)